MSILIKGMEMPESCELCAIKAWDEGDGGYVCPFSGVPTTNLCRQYDCPLIPVPPHGRLIDADALDERVHERQDRIAGSDIHRDWTVFCTLADVRDCIDNAPTIIEAEEEVDDG